MKQRKTGGKYVYKHKIYARPHKKQMRQNVESVKIVEK